MSKRNSGPSLTEFSIDRKEASVVVASFQIVSMAAFIAGANWIFFLLLKHDWYSQNFVTKIIAFAFTPIWIFSLVCIAVVLWAVGIAVRGILVRKYGETDKRGPDSETALLDLVKSDARTLAKKRMQLSTKDEFGTPNTRKWEQELRRYIREVLPAKLDTEHHRFAILWLSSQKNVQKLRDLIDGEYQALLSEDTKIDELNPLEYEQYCSRRLENMGWSASITRASGDQGADVLANKNGQSLVLQCKKYSKPIGNKAVQEAIAAQKFYRTDMAAVVTNQSFTKSARELAHMSGILLLHHTELDLFA
ncbi:restriction endonuclease [Brucella intermedia]|uniref:Restriction endonuclease n=1 Tax=Brucella intermedia GD04153 TaxID=2975438 RepID=A0AA42GXC9_9HYPH|nr:restriction endonuclease [Brucella intermedia]MDH0123319.1 restriction endonuclease [Brucella intermedia GD04153]